jgi:hypothetical protein
MMRRILSMTLSVALVFSLVPPVSAAGTGRISGLARTLDGRYLGGQLARLRSLDVGHVADVTTTSTAGEFSFRGMRAGSYVVELISTSGYVVATSAPVVLTTRSMTADGVTATAPVTAAQAQAGAGGGFWTGTAGIITIAAIAAGVITAVVVATNDGSPSQ